MPLRDCGLEWLEDCIMAEQLTGLLFVYMSAFKRPPSPPPPRYLPDKELIAKGLQVVAPKP